MMPVSQDGQQVVLKRTLDATTYYVTIRWEGKAFFGEKDKNYFVLTPEEDTLAFTCAFTPEGASTETATAVQTEQKAAEYWTAFWKNGAAVDFSACTDTQGIGTPCGIESISSCYPMCRNNPSTRDWADLQLLVWQVSSRNDLVASGSVCIVEPCRIA